MDKFAGLSSELRTIRDISKQVALDLQRSHSFDDGQAGYRAVLELRSQLVDTNNRLARLCERGLEYFQEN